MSVSFLAEPKSSCQLLDEFMEITCLLTCWKNVFWAWAACVQRNNFALKSPFKWMKVIFIRSQIWEVFLAAPSWCFCGKTQTEDTGLSQWGSLKVTAYYYSYHKSFVVLAAQFAQFFMYLSPPAVENQHSSLCLTHLNFNFSLKKWISPLICSVFMSKH